MSNVDPLDPSTFPDPHTWSSYVSFRTTSYKTHSSLAKAKDAVAYFFDINDVLVCDVRLYQ